MVILFLWQYIHKKRIYYCSIIDKDIKSWRARLLAGHYFIISKEKKNPFFYWILKKAYKSLYIFPSLRLSFIFLFPFVIFFLILSYVTYLEVRSNYLKITFHFDYTDFFVFFFLSLLYLVYIYHYLLSTNYKKIWYSQWILLNFDITWHKNIT